MRETNILQEIYKKTGGGNHGRTISIILRVLFDKHIEVLFFYY